jgi:uncharacterized protein (DUF2126 family)
MGQAPGTPARRMELFAITPAPDPLPAVLRASDAVPELIRPSLCVQAREGRLHVFLPYAPKLADYLDLVSAVEDTCQYLKIPVWVEGYAPAPDPRLRSFSVTPDPGVLEVNLPPASNWDELERINTLLDGEARRNRLTAEKFAYDGSRIATGGGNHIVIGGATLLDSPILRRPDLLRSMVAFWQNHPSLSYLFSGMYVGPTSQYPRVDEARMDALYELEIAFRNLPSGDCPPFVIDGLFRNLLVDSTGNSHRAEFCVDKLYPPEGLGLQLGLLELRAFEMAPHVQMNLLQMLLIRALVSMFWKTPFEGSLIRWGTTLHDRFMLPDFVRRDLREVLARLRLSGYNFEDEWFDSHFGVSLSEDRIDRRGRSRTRTASGPRALERARGGNLFRPHGSYRGLIDGADAGEGVRVLNGIPLCCCLQWAQGAASTYRRARRSIGRRAVSCAAVVGVIAPYSSRSCAPCLPPYRLPEGLLDWPMHLPCWTTRRPFLRCSSSQRCGS